MNSALPRHRSLIITVVKFMSVCVTAAFVVSYSVISLYGLRKEDRFGAEERKSQHGHETVYADCSPFVCGTCEWDSKCPNVFFCFSLLDVVGRNI